MAMGVPVLACRVPSTQIFVEKTGAGVLIDPPSAINLAETIVDLLKNPYKRKKMAENGKRAIAKYYNWPLMENRLFKIYEQVLEC